MRLSSRTAASLFLAVPATLLVACWTVPAAEVPTGATEAPAASAPDTATPDPAPAPSSSAAAAESELPPKAECDAFMDVIARVTALRASIQRDPSTAVKAADWATRTAEIAAQAKKLALANQDLVIENANLVTRMTELASDLRALEAAEKATDLAKTNAAHKHVLDVSEQVEVITREPAARCAGDTKQLRTTPGRLPPAKIQAVVRDHFGDFKRCYEDGLARDPKLVGRVAVRFVIARNGAVDTVADGSSDPIPVDAVAPPSNTTLGPMPDAKVVACVLAAMKKLTFPKPDGGVVTVVYPLVFAPAP